MSIERADLARALLGVTIGLAMGVGGYTFVYARGAAYLTNNPAACANCHIMREHYEGWLKSSHHTVAVCNDCHTPSGLLAKYATKATNGFWHSFAFTSGRFADPLHIKPHNRLVTEGACRECHQDLIAAIENRPSHRGVLPCTTCHKAVGHQQ